MKANIFMKLRSVILNTSISGLFPVNFRFSKFQWLNSLFQTTGTIQGCDGKRAKGTKRRGIHYKRKRFTRKMTKALFKIGRRKPITRKGQKELEKNNAQSQFRDFTQQNLARVYANNFEKYSAQRH